jgi:G3E family GTPase
MPADTRIPVTIVGGYLGAGKTTLVNQLLRQRAGQRIAVLVNDFGELSIDDELIESRDGALLRLAGGCVCCSFGSDLMAALQQMCDLQPAPEHILIECSGVAHPAAVARTLGLLPKLALDAVLVLADAETLRERAADRYVGELVRQQLREADLIALNKSDRVARDALGAVQDWLAQVAPRARVLPCCQARLDPALLLGHGPATRAGPRAHRGLAVARSDDAATLFDSLSLEFEYAVHAQALAAALAAPHARLLRSKALLRGLDGSLQVLHTVGARHKVHASAHARPQVGRLVCIALRGQLDAAHIRALLREHAVTSTVQHRASQ